MVFAGAKGGREGICNFFLKGNVKLARNSLHSFVNFFFHNLLLYDLEWLLKQRILGN